MPFEMLFDSDHKVLLVRFGRALTRQALESMVKAEVVGVHGNCDGIVDFSAVEKLDIDVQEAYHLLGLKDLDFQPFAITDRSPE